MINRIISIIIFLSLTYTTSCISDRNKDAVQVSFNEDYKRTMELEEVDSIPTLRIAIAPVLSPKESFGYYQDLFEYMGERLQMKIEFRQRMTYEDVNTMLERNLVDIAFICTGAYVEGEDRFELLAGPIYNNQPYYKGYIITNKLSGIKNFEDLRDRSFAFTDPLSNAGRYYPLHLLNEINETPESYFNNTLYTMSHDLSIQMVARNMVDGASVSGLIFEYVKKNHPEMVKNVEIIEKSENYGSPPIVNSLLLDRRKKEEIQKVFLELHTHERGQKILDNLLIERFAVVDDSIYDYVRNMYKSLWEEK
jgi:phosphonate transport system substrate-binding protein